MNLTAYTYRLQGLLSQAQNILIFIKGKPDLDAIASGLALYLSLSQRGKQVMIVCPDEMTVSESSLFAVDKITNDLGKRGKNLVISFPYVEGSIEKVSYNIENNRFNLIIEPRGETYLLDKNNVEFSRSGEGILDFDLIFTIGLSNLSGLGKFSSSLQKVLQEKQVVVIDTIHSQLPFGTLQIVSPTNTTISEMITIILSKLNLPIDREIADNLLKGIKEKTRNFSQAGADTFEAAAICMRKTQAKIAGSLGPLGPTPTFEKPQPLPNSRPSGKPKTPPDWLKPKIFRSKDSSALDEEDRGTIL